MTPRRIAWLIAGVCLTPACVFAHATPTPPGSPSPPAVSLASADPWALLAALPASVDAAAVLDRPGERLWSDPAGLAFRAVLSATGLFAQTEQAWAGLAAALGYTGDQAAGALLGRTVLIAWDGLARGDGTGAFGAAGRADTRWAVVAQIDPDTARSLRATLNAAPRRTHLGRVIYSVDAGRTAMAIIDDGAQTRVVFAPNGASSLLDSLLAPAAAGASALAGRAQAALGNAEPGWAAVGAIRLPNSDTPAAMELRTAHGAWGIRLAGPGETPAADPADPDRERFEGSPVGVLAQIGGDPLLAAAFRGGPRFDGRTFDLGLRFGLNAPSPTTTPGSATETAPTPINASPEPLRPGRGGLLILHAADRAQDNQPTLVAQLISHARSDQPYPQTVDRVVSAMIGGSHPPEHRGAFPAAVRTHTLKPSSSTTDWPGPDARIAWCLAPDADPTSGAMSMSIAPAGLDPAPFARDGRAAWLRGMADHDPAMITAGHARIGELWRMLRPDGAAGISGLARSIERVDWTVRAQAGLTRAEILMRFTDPGTRLGGP
jgi:hypothetical protein